MKQGVIALVLALLGAAGVARAQDADSDGVLDRSDRCRSTPAGAAVDPAGCASVCDAQVVGPDGFARTLLTELGLGELGTFGSKTPPPAGYHPRGSLDPTLPRGLGIVANPERDGFAVFDGDYVTSGVLEEGWGITIRDTSRNNNSATGGDIRGSILSATCLPTGLCGARGGARVTWQGRDSVTGVLVEQEALILHEGLAVIVNVRLSNTTADALEVFYLRTIDPDGNHVLSGVAQTRNTVVSQLAPLGGGAEARVSAVHDAALDATITNDAYLALASRHRSAVASHGGVANRSARAAHVGLSPFAIAEGDTRNASESINLAFRFDLAAGGSVAFTYVYVMGATAADLADALACAEVDSDFDGVPDSIDVDDDDDGVPDLLELPAFSGDPGADSDGDGVADWQDPDSVPGGCADDARPIGVCDTVPASIDTDRDGVPDHLDLDSDRDGITDTLESGGDDADGDGRPDACVGHSAVGGCESAPGVSLLVTSLIDTDGSDGPDLRDPDSDGDGISDNDEAHDVDGDGAADTVSVGGDHDGDGIDDAYDPDASGAPVTAPLAAHRDADGDGAGDWLEVCGDAYVTGAEICDTGALRDTCSAVCLLAGMQPCTGDAECDSMICDPATRTCAPCVDSTSGGVDDGCTSDRPLCLAMSCEVCDDTATGASVDEGCGADLPECDVATRTCGTCTDPACAFDAGVGDAGAGDAGMPRADAGIVDAGLDASIARPVGSGLTCAASPAHRGRVAPLLFFAVLALVAVRRR